MRIEDARQLLTKLEAKQTNYRITGQYDLIEGVEFEADAIVNSVLAAERRNELIDLFTWGLVDSCPEN